MIARHLKGIFIYSGNKISPKHIYIYIFHLKKKNESTYLPSSPGAGFVHWVSWSHVPCLRGHQYNCRTRPSYQLPDILALQTVKMQFYSVMQSFISYIEEKFNSIVCKVRSFLSPLLVPKP